MFIFHPEPDLESEPDPLPDDASLLEILRHGHFTLERRMMLEARIDHLANNRDGVHYALNDFYLRPGIEEASPTCCLELEIDGEVVDQYRGDGLIIATPTGSTGYSMAAGGPIIHPSMEGIVVNPICPISLSSRAIVVPPEACLSVWPLGDRCRRVTLWKDGAHATVLDTGDRCVLQRSSDQALFVVLSQSPSYYRTLSRKLHWAGSLTSAEPGPN